MIIQGWISHEALAANVAGKGVGFPTMDSQVLFQLVFVPEGLPTVGAFKRTETLPDKKVLQRCILRCKRKRQSSTSRYLSNVFWNQLRAWQMQWSVPEEDISWEKQTMENDKRNPWTLCFSAILQVPPTCTSICEGSRHWGRETQCCKASMGTMAPHKLNKKINIAFKQTESPVLPVFSWHDACLAMWDEHLIGHSVPDPPLME